MDRLTKTILREAEEWDGRTQSLSRGEFVMDRNRVLYRCDPNHRWWMNRNGLLQGYGDFDERAEIMRENKLVRIMVSQVHGTGSEFDLKAFIDPPFSKSQKQAVINLCIEHSSIGALENGYTQRIIWRREGIDR